MSAWHGETPLPWPVHLGIEPECKALGRRGRCRAQFRSGIGAEPNEDPAPSSLAAAVLVAGPVTDAMVAQPRLTPIFTITKLTTGLPFRVWMMVPPIRAFIHNRPRCPNNYVSLSRSSHGTTESAQCYTSGENRSHGNASNRCIIQNEPSGVRLRPPSHNFNIESSFRVEA
jgi:hypothetical protein